MIPRSLTDDILRYHRLETSAERRFKKAMADGSTHTARRAAQLWQATSARFDTVALANVSTYRD
jgi:hypothetical protein